tara:strand:- start:44 stop:667 length:624 start_codon:yes stop_codon:yes gene_type:complete
MLFELFKEDFKDHKLLEFKKPYKNFMFKNGYSKSLVNTEFWWTEDLIHDFLLTEKVFDNSPIFYTRECEMKNFNLSSIIKGPFSPVDLWVPGKAFIEIKYTAHQSRDHWGYDFYPKRLSNIWHHFKDMKHKIYLVLIHGIDSVSMIDLSDKEKITRVSNFIKLNVNKDNCFKRWDGLKDKIRAYRNGDYVLRSKIEEDIKNQIKENI